MKVFFNFLILLVTIAVIKIRGLKGFFVSNYRGKKVFLCGFFLTSISVLITTLLTENAVLVMISQAAFLVGISGLIDDLYGSSEKGFKGHLSALLKGKVTTGMFKLLSITILSFVVAFYLEKDFFSRITTAIILASTSNLFNLLDLRPGRSVKFALPIFLAGILTLEGELKQFALLLSVVYCIYLILDVKEYAMLGDSGANSLGFFAATIIIFAVKITLYKFLLALVLVGLNLISEKVSFTRIIEQNKILDFVDRLGRIKVEEEGRNGKKL